jgi:cytochrome b6
MKRSTFFEHLHPPTIPAREARFRYTFGLGGIALFLFFSLIVTGALELFYYIPSPEGANRSVQLITFLVPFGWLVRSLHYWAAQALVVVVVLHLLRVVFTGAYKRPRRFNWLLGVSLLVFVLLLDFTGYVLRWDEGISWALIVGTNLLKSIPLIGSDLYGAIVGGQEIGADTVIRFYSWHIFGLVVVGVGLIAWHIFRVRRDGGISSLPKQELKERIEVVVSPPRRIARAELVQREALAMLLVMIALLGVSILFPPSIGPAGDFTQSPAEAIAPWFFIWVQQLLRWGDPFPMGVLIPIGLLVLLAALPYVIDRSPGGVARWFNREGRAAQLFAVLVLISIVGLTLIGLQP